MATKRARAEANTAIKKANTAIRKAKTAIKKACGNSLRGGLHHLLLWSPPPIITGVFVDVVQFGPAPMYCWVRVRATYSLPSDKFCVDNMTACVKNASGVVNPSISMAKDPTCSNQFTSGITQLPGCLKGSTIQVKVTAAWHCIGSDEFGFSSYTL